MNVAAAIKVATAVHRIEQGNCSNVKGVGANAYECRIDFGPGYQIYFGKAVLRDYINMAIGFEELSRVFEKSSKSLMRTFGPKGNPQASNLFSVIGYLQGQMSARADGEGNPGPRSLSIRKTASTVYCR